MILRDNGTFNLYGGLISDNAAQNGGIFAAGSFTMVGGSIIRNTSDEGGSGVFVNVDRMGAASTFTVSGDVTIQYNGQDGSSDNVCLEEYGGKTATSTIDGALIGGMGSIGVTREQLATLLYRFYGTPAVSGTLSFADAGEVSDYARSALLWATQNGILNGVGNNRVAPSLDAQRAQVAAMMARYLKNAG